MTGTSSPRPADEVAALFAVDPVGLGGVVLRAAAGPARDAWAARLTALLPAGDPSCRVPLHVGDDRLLGGLDLASTLHSGRVVAQRGLLAASDGGVVWLAMAERVTATTAAHLAAVLDTGSVVAERDGMAQRATSRIGVVALDEGLGEDEAAPARLAERCAFWLALEPGSIARPSSSPTLLPMQSHEAPVAAPFPHQKAQAVTEWLPLPPEEDEGLRRAFESHATSRQGGSGSQTGTRTASEGREPPPTSASRADIAAARARLPFVTAPDDVIEAICAAALALGIDSLRPPLFALRTAKAAAALAGRREVSAADAACAARLVLAPRATRLPAREEVADDADAPSTGDRSPTDAAPPAVDDPGASTSEPVPLERSADDTTSAAPTANAAAAGQPSHQPASDPDPTSADAPTDIVLQAALAAVPPHLLDRLTASAPGAARAAVAGRSGATRVAALRGRPSGVRRGVPRDGARLNLIETLRAAAPWQALRRREIDPSDGAGGRRIIVLPRDFHVTRHVQRSETTTVFVVDASGSAALHRLAEAKGAVELLLADCYVRRDSVAVIAFRGRSAELLLPPTRSLARAKRSLAGLPGGGGTPLAAGLEAANTLADAVRRRGATPLIVLLTDGRGNIALDGSTGRAGAERDARAAAGRLRAAGFASLLLDTSARPQDAARVLADAMGAAYLPLPHAEAGSLSQVVRHAGSSNAKSRPSV